MFLIFKPTAGEIAPPMTGRSSVHKFQEFHRSRANNFPLNSLLHRSSEFHSTGVYQSPLEAMCKACALFSSNICFSYQKPLHTPLDAMMVTYSYSAQLPSGGVRPESSESDGEGRIFCRVVFHKRAINDSSIHPGPVQSSDDDHLRNTYGSRPTISFIVFLGNALFF